MSYKFQTPGEHKEEDMILCEMHSWKDVQKVAAMKLEEGDVVVASYPKAGTTVLQELVWLVRNNADIAGSQKVANYARVPFIDIGVTDTVALFNDLPKPRTMKTHVPWRHLPQGVLQGKNKVICPIRNPKDTLVSYYHFHRMNALLGNFKGTWNDFFQYMMDNGGIVLYGNPLDHYKTYWEHRNDPNVLLVFYEDIIRDRDTVVKKIADFLKVKLSADQVKAISKATDFDTMKASPMTNMDLARGLPPGAPQPPLDHSISPFLRKGKIGDWQNYFSDEQSAVIDRWCQERLAGTGLTFTYT